MCAIILIADFFLNLILGVRYQNVILAKERTHQLKAPVCNSCDWVMELNYGGLIS